MAYDFKELEEEIGNNWEKKKVYEKLKSLRSKGKKFYFLDGPPYATGSIHLGTAMNKILKDFYLRYFRMKGFNVWDQPGYDTHGVPIENKVEQKLGFKSKQDIEKFGVEKFIKECRSFVTQFVDVQSKQFANLGVWMDWSRPYITLNNEYIEGAWYTFKKAFEKGFLFKGNYSVHVCTRCQTAVAYNEIIYQKVTDPAIYVKFKVKGSTNEFLVIFTTTPWTLLSNMGIMVKPSADYVKVRTDNEVLIVAKNLLKGLMEKFGFENYKILETFKGEKLEGLEYEHPLFDLLPFLKSLKKIHRVVLSEQYVNLDEGTGEVHMAPGHGKEDYEVGVKNNLPVINPLKLNGTYNENCGKYSGLYAKDADKIIIEDLRKRNALIYSDEVNHDYPLCWRCNYPLLQMAVPQWFFRVTKIREKLLKENEKINWVPEWAGQRFKNWLESLGDWPISRQRYWGIPLPIWVCDKCEEVNVVGSREELPKVPSDFHKPYIDEIKFECKKCKKGTMKRVPDVLDVWFDSGVAPWASLNYPKNKKEFERLWPVDFILEGPDQIRGWWNSLMITSVLTFDRRSFDNVLFHGFVLDSHGVKMSKSKGNVVEPEKMIEKYGRDVTRLYFLLGAPWEDYYFKWEDMEEVQKFFIVLKNTFNYIKTYSSDVTRPKKFELEDLWLLSKINSLIKESTKNNQEFNAQKSAKDIVNFVETDLSRFYIKLIRERTLEEDKSLFFTLKYVGENILKLFAPFAPYLTDKVYLELNGEKESVHLEEWPIVENEFIDKKLEEKFNLFKDLLQVLLSEREKTGYGIRWPLKKVVVKGKNASELKDLNELIKTQVNVKEVSFVKEEIEGFKVEFDKTITKELEEEGYCREIMRRIQDLRKKNNLKREDKINLDIKFGVNLKGFEKDIKERAGVKVLTFNSKKHKESVNGKIKDKDFEISFEAIRT